MDALFRKEVKTILAAEQAAMWGQRLTFGASCWVSPACLPCEWGKREPTLIWSPGQRLFVTTERQDQPR